jgi:hypothetical protein
VVSRRVGMATVGLVPAIFTQLLQELTAREGGPAE